MKVFTPNDKLCALVLQDVNLLPVINRFGIKLGFKDKTIQEVCAEHEVNTDFFIAIVNTYINEDYFPERKLQSFSPLLIIDYLKRTHKHYFTYIIPKIEESLNKVIEGEMATSENLSMINSFYKQYKHELITHLETEEQETFPYIEHLVTKQSLPKDGKLIKNVRQEHTDVETKLSDLKNLIIKYLDPHYDTNDMNDFLHTLDHFERDLNDHSRIEDVILIQQVSELEAKLTSNAN